MLSALSLSAVGACGFTPLYGEGTSARAITGQVQVDILPGSFGFALRERLVNRLGAPNSARYQLSLTTNITSDQRAIRADRTITRFNLNATTTYTLTPLSGGPPADSGTVKAFTAYSAVASPFATRTAEQDARRRLAVTLADQIVQRLALTSADWAL